MTERDRLPIAILGAGPVGLAAAAHLVERGARVVVIEAAPHVGASLRSWSHVRMFSPWRYDVDAAARRLLEPTGWRAPDDDALPTGGELVAHYLEPLARVLSERVTLRLGARVVSVTRRGLDKTRTELREALPFVIRLESDEEILARGVIDATGTWQQPSPMGSSGLPARGERALAAAGVIAYGIPDVLGGDRDVYRGLRTLVVGAGHSAAHAILSLARLEGASVVWALRGSDTTRVFGGGEADGFPARGEIGLELQRLVREERVTLRTSFGIESIARSASGALEVHALDGRSVEVDRVIVATGSRPDLSITREVRTSIDPMLECAAELAPLIDPNVHSCGTVRPHGARALRQPDAGLYVLGSKSYGRAPTFLLATGYEQARSIAAEIAGDRVAAETVMLELPETGVCGGTSCCPIPSASAPAACCG